MPDTAEKMANFLAIRSRAVPSEYAQTIFHYTAPSAIDSILFRKKENGRPQITLWASRYDCLNDASEGSIVDQVFATVCGKMYARGELSEKMYQLCRAAKGDKESIFYCLDREKEIGESWYSKSHRFIASFSRNPDSLAMWKYYSKGSGYEGMNLGFHLKSLRQSFSNRQFRHIAWFQVLPVVYQWKEQAELIWRAVKDLQEDYRDELKSCEEEVLGNLSTLLSDWMLIFKSAYFEHEEEVRIIVDLPQINKYAEHSIPIEYRHSNGCWIPYIQLSFDADALTQVTLGPTSQDSAQKERQRLIVEEMLRSKGYESPRAVCSDIPVRY